MTRYHFWGWETADVAPTTSEFPGIANPRDLYDALSHVWCADTCAPRLREGWSAENPTLGQCSITSFLAQDIFGGEVMGVLRPGGNYHCFNVVGTCRFDLTSEQFGDEELDYDKAVPQSREVHFAKEEKRLRYEMLRKRLARYCLGRLLVVGPQAHGDGGASRQPAGTGPAQGVGIRCATSGDVDALLAIYRPYVEETAISFEWEVPSAQEFARRMEHTLERYPYLVAERNGAILGYAYAGPFVGRAAYDWSVETTIYLAQDVRRQGIGRRLYLALEESLRRMGILNLNACIGVPREDNDEHLTRASVLFHGKLGYREVGTFQACGYKFGRWYDMAWMEKLIGSHSAEVAPVRSFASVYEGLVRDGILTA